LRIFLDDDDDDDDAGNSRRIIKKYYEVLPIKCSCEVLRRVYNIKKKE
jgi:hypothetical protein